MRIAVNLSVFMYHPSTVAAGRRDDPNTGSSTTVLAIHCQRAARVRIRARLAYAELDTSIPKYDFSSISKVDKATVSFCLLLALHQLTYNCNKRVTTYVT